MIFNKIAKLIYARLTFSHMSKYFAATAKIKYLGDLRTECEHV